MQRNRWMYGVLGLGAVGVVSYFGYKNRARLSDYFSTWRTRRRIASVAPQVTKRSQERFDRGATLAEHVTASQKT